MKKVLLSFMVLLISFSFLSCTDKCKETRVIVTRTPILHPFSEIRNSVKALPARSIQDPGIICEKDNYLFINEVKKGVHVIDNSDPASPRFVAFINIPGNGDFVIRGNTLYADSYSDLVSIDITNPSEPKEIGRINEIFTFGMFYNVQWQSHSDGLIWGDFTEKFDSVNAGCNDDIIVPAVKALRSNLTIIGPEYFPKATKRFAMSGKFLYAISGYSNVQIIDLENGVSPVLIQNFTTEPVLTSINASGDKLFLGSYLGIIMYQNTSSGIPEKILVLPKTAPCDQVIAHDNTAYVLQGSDSFCSTNPSALSSIDISKNPPKWMKTYMLEGPYKISLKYPYLYVAEEKKGLKVFDVTDDVATDQHLLAFKSDIKPKNVLAFGKTVLVVTDDNLYQFDISDPKTLRQLSSIPVKKANI